MYYYKISLPVKIDQLFTYSSKNEIKKGSRVYVSFQNTFHTGIIWEKDSENPTSQKIKPILNIIDEIPKLSLEQSKLAEWISKYYQVPLGIVLSAMLPRAFNIQTILKVRKVIPEKEKIEFLELEEHLSSEWTDISFLKGKIPKLFEKIEYLENQGSVEVSRTFDQRIKKKVANFVILNSSYDSSKLTEKQAEVYSKLLKLGTDFPLAKIAHDHTYYMIKTLRNKGCLQIEPREVKTVSNLIPKIRKKRKLKLNDEQEKAFQIIEKDITKNRFRTFLLFGITGSGKTEVYIEAIKSTLQKGKTALLLVPEISLTPQMVERFFNAFGEDIAILHSHLNEREKWEQWQKIKSGKSKIVIGARSAIFAPLKNIGIIIVDEEHESSYKQETDPSYNGRDVAIVRAKLSQAVVILGSATPSLESWKNAHSGKYHLLKLKKRPQNSELPEVKIIDMRSEKDPNQSLSQKLRDNIESRLKRKEQIILLQNRRGHSSFVQCVQCGRLFECSDCEISMNFHSKEQSLMCHYCGKKQKLPRKCPDCGSHLFRFGAPGTQQIEKQLRIIFPQAKIQRMDSDTTRSKDSYDSMFQRMRNGNIDILLGTQMIAKGLDFPNVTLVGVVSADIGLNIPDFRAAERTFQLLTQVAGRSGRAEKKGEVFIQTFNPEHFSIKFAMQQDFPKFAKMELELRERLNYPPEIKLVRFLFTHKDHKFLRRQIFQNHGQLEKLKKKLPDLSILGPVEAPFPKMQNRFRYHLIIKTKKVMILSQVVNFLKDHLQISSAIRVKIDVDPYSLM